MRVDQAGHENPAAAIDHLRTIRRRRVARDWALIRLPSTSRRTPSRKEPDFPSNNRKFANRIGRDGGAGTGCAVACRDSPSDAIEVAMPATKPRHERSVLTRRARTWISGLWQRHPAGLTRSASSSEVHENMDHPQTGLRSSAQERVVKTADTVG